jgi:hypothetical protein
MAKTERTGRQFAAPDVVRRDKVPGKKIAKNLDKEK